MGSAVLIAGSEGRAMGPQGAEPPGPVKGGRDGSAPLRPSPLIRVIFQKYFSQVRAVV